VTCRNARIASSISGNGNAAKTGVKTPSCMAIRS
jgi:hypothetical protein